MEKQKEKREKGITLIALVITIIVLLILATVSIATLTGQNGILTRANDAKKENEIASVKEQARLDISNYVAEKLENGEDSTVNTPEKVQEILEVANQNNENKYYKGFTETGITTPSGYEVPYEELYTTGSSGEETTSKTVGDLVAGEKVYYDAGNTSIGDQGIIVCTVLYDEEYNKKNNTNYGIQLYINIPGEYTSIGYDMIPGEESNFERGKNVYNNAIKILNSKAEKYLNEKYAKDARCLGSVPDNKNSEPGFYTREDKWFADFNNIYKNSDNNYEIDYNQLKKLNITNGNYTPLASRVVESDDRSSKFNLRYLVGDKIMNVGMGGIATENIEGPEYDIYTNGPDDSIETNVFSVIVTLKEGIKITNGDGKDTPYTLKAE